MIAKKGLCGVKITDDLVDGLDLLDVGSGQASAPTSSSGLRICGKVAHYRIALVSGYMYLPVRRQLRNRCAEIAIAVVY